MQQSLKNVMDNMDNEALTFVTQNDIQRCYQDSQILVLEAPLGSNLSIASAVNKVKHSNKLSPILINIYNIKVIL